MDSSAKPPSATDEAAKPPSSDAASSDAGTAKEPSVTGAKRSREWYGASGDGGTHAAQAHAAAALAEAETKAVVSSIKGKLSKPKVGSGSSNESARKSGITKSEMLEEQARHRARMEAKGKPVPHYRK